jgi:hypothetical protein
MAKSKRTKDTVAIGTWPTPEAIRAKVFYLRGKYFLTIGRSKLEIPVGTIVTEQDARSMVGKDVYAAVSGKNIVAIARIPDWIICYIPAPDFLKKVRPDVQRNIIEKMASEKIITPRLKAELLRGL